MFELISSTKSNLKKMLPNAKDILIKVERDHDQFLSKIHVNVPGNILHAEKKAESVWEAIDSSYQAVLKQFERIKTKQISKRKIKKEVFRRIFNTK